MPQMAPILWLAVMVIVVVLYLFCLEFLHFDPSFSSPSSLSEETSREAKCGLNPWDQTLDPRPTSWMITNTE
uniref:ATP synthase complex subunit 8 n=1 Tax=Bovicola ovis TaxID=186214 RepID=A0A386B279_9NEOP|nr:ATP synthase F0 subunit 8 [Bovicola ovis]